MTTMTHEKYNELQKKMDKLYSDFVDVAAEVEKLGDDMQEVSKWIYDNINPIIEWAIAHNADEKILADLQADYDELNKMLEC